VSVERGPSVPVLVYHSIAPGERIGPGLFETHLRVLTRSGLPSLAARELDTAQKGFLLTFDDGFSDLWSHGLPLLKAHQVKAVVFAIASRPEEGEPRPQEERLFPGDSGDVLAQSARADGPHPGFLRWSELRKLEESGLVEVQSHSFEHRVVWAGDGIRGFHLGSRGRAHWSLPQATEGDERLGIPLYRRRSSLASRRYWDDPGLRDVLARWMEERGGEAYVASKGVQTVEAELHAEARAYREKHPDRGRWETEEERAERTVLDLARAKETLEARLGGVRDELCLPWGHHDAVTLECARRVGIRRVYTTGRGANPAGRIGYLVQRFGPMRRTNGALWLRWRLWLYRSAYRAGLYGSWYGLKPKQFWQRFWP